MDCAGSILIAANPKSGSSDRSRLVQALCDRVNRLGFHAKLVTDLSELERTAKSEYLEGRLHGVVAAGGDGTAAAVVARIDPSVPIALFPLGTENLLARHFGISADVEQVSQLIAKGEPETLDAGLANGKLFLLMASAGFDAEVVRLVHSQRRGHIHHWTYAWPIVRSILFYRFPKIQVQLVGNEEGSVTTKWCFAFNFPRYAGGLEIAPQASPDDSKLDLCLFQSGGLWRGIAYWLKLRKGQHGTLRDFLHRRFDHAVITSSVPVPYQLDGDAGGWLPMKIEVLPKRFRLFVPRKAC